MHSRVISVRSEAFLYSNFLQIHVRNMVEFMVAIKIIYLFANLQLRLKTKMKNE